jgi:hypothetical protein
MALLQSAGVVSYGDVRRVSAATGMTAGSDGSGSVPSSGAGAAPVASLAFAAGSYGGSPGAASPGAPRRSRVDLVTGVSGAGATDASLDPDPSTRRSSAVAAHGGAPPPAWGTSGAVPPFRVTLAGHELSVVPLHARALTSVAAARRRDCFPPAGSDLQPVPPSRAE